MGKKNESRNEIILDVKKLEEGKVFKNYKELCNILGFEVAEGNTKQAQLKELERFCRYRKEGHKFIIEEVYAEPKEKEDNRLDRKTIEIMGNMLIEQICIYGKKGSLETHFSKGLLYKICQMHNEQYSFYQYKQRELAELEKVDIDTVRDLYSISNSVFISNVEKGARYLKNKRLATMFDTYAIKTEYGEKAVTKKQHALIQSYEAQVIEEVFHTNREILYLENGYHKLRKAVCKMITEKASILETYTESELRKVLHGDTILSLKDMKYYYTCYSFVGDVDRIKKYYDKQYLKQLEAKAENENGEKVNERTIEKISESVDTKIKNSKEGKSNKIHRKKDTWKEYADKFIEKQIAIDKAMIEGTYVEEVEEDK